MKQQYLAAVALLSLMFCAVGAENNSSVFLEGAEINDSGFRPNIDGFSFQNYADDPVTVDLTPAELQRMFGDKVCASIAGGKCTLTYPAQALDESGSFRYEIRTLRRHRGSIQPYVL